jgi:hypothetical protein
MRKGEEVKEEREVSERGGKEDGRDEGLRGLGREKEE